MAPPRRVTRQSINVTLSAYDVEEQIQEMRRYEQEMKDRRLAQNMQRQEEQETILAVPAPIIIQNRAPDEPSGPRVHSVQLSSISDQLADVPPPSPILAGAPRIRRRVNEVSTRQRAPIVLNGRSVIGPIRQTNRRNTRPSEVSRRPERNNHRNEVIIETSDEDTDNDSADGNDIQVLPNPENASNSIRNFDNLSSSDSSMSTMSVASRNTVSTVSTINSNVSSPVIRAFVGDAAEMYVREFAPTYNRPSTSIPINSDVISPVIQAFVGNDAEMYAREYAPIDNQPSTSQPIPATPIRKGEPDGSWGDCTMCFEIPIRPQGCNGCYQIIGCRTCVDSWFRSSQFPSCPLCRRKWIRKPDVSTMATIDGRRRSKTIRRAQNANRNRMVASND